MKNSILALAATGLAALAAGAAPEQHTTYGDVARVVSSTPIHERSPDSRRECRVEGTGYNPAASEIRPCDEAAGDPHDRIVAYDVRYEYNGREFRVRMPYEPGERIAVNVEVRPPLPRDPGGPRIPRYRGPY